MQKTAVEPAVNESPPNQALEGVYRAADDGIVALRPPTDGLTVLFFYSRECPIANFYIPVINDLVGRHGTERIRWVGVCVDPDITPEVLLDHASEYSIGFPVIADPRGELATAVGAGITPEVTVFDRKGDLIYRGRIDDQYAARGVKSPTIERHDLDDAVKAGLAGKVPERRETEATGCPLPDIAPAQETSITYTQHIAPLIFRSCLQCHREGSIAPFPLETYQQARRRADDLANVTASRFMPPWRLASKFGQRVQHDLSLSDDEISLFSTWAEQGAMEGDPELLPEKPPFTDGWGIGTPDLVLEMPEPFVVPATGPDVMRCFPIATGLTEGRYVSAIEIQPGNPRVVHHAINYLVPSGVAATRDKGDPGPGYDCFGGPGVSIVGELGSWGPGTAVDKLPSGLARRLPAGLDIILHMHYHPTGKEEMDLSRIGIYFSREPVRQSFHWMLLVSGTFMIPPGATNYELSASREVPMDVMVHMVKPHMHLIGKDMDVWFEKPDGTRVDLVRADPWDFKWQANHYLMEPVLMPKGSMIRIVGHFDNSSGNPANPFRAEPREIGPGEETTDEMLACVIGVTKFGQDLTCDGYETDKPLFASDWDTGGATAGWGLWAAPGAGKASLELTPAGVRVIVPTAEARSQEPKVNVRHVTAIRKGLLYEVTLRMKSDAPRNVLLCVLKNQRPWTALCKAEPIKLTEDWQVIHKTFSIDYDERNAQVIVIAGADGIPFDIADFSIEATLPDKPTHAAMESSQQ